MAGQVGKESQLMYYRGKGGERERRVKRMERKGRREREARRKMTVRKAGSETADRKNRKL